MHYNHFFSDPSALCDEPKKNSIIVSLSPIPNSTQNTSLLFLSVSRLLSECVTCDGGSNGDAPKLTHFPLDVGLLETIIIFFSSFLCVAAFGAGEITRIHMRIYIDTLIDR